MITIKCSAKWNVRLTALLSIVMVPSFAGDWSDIHPQRYSPLVGNTPSSHSQANVLPSARSFNESFWYRPIPQRSQTVGIDLFGSPNLSLGISGGKRPGRYMGYPATRENFGALDDSYELGLFTNGRYGNYLFGTRVSKDVSGGHDGVLGEFMAGYERQFTKKLGLSVGVGATWADKNFAASYYGVQTGDGTRSELQQYTPGDGFTDATLQMTACYQLTENWSFGAKIGYSRRMGSAADNTVTNFEDSRQQFITGLQLQFALPDIGTKAPRHYYQPNCSVY